MAYSSQAVQKNKRSFLDPRVKIVLVLLLAIFVMGGVCGARMKDISFVLSIIPFVLLLIEQQWKKIWHASIMLIIGYGCLLVMPYLPYMLRFIPLMCGYILTHFVATVAMGNYVIATTSVSEFIAAMEKILGSPIKRTNICQIGFRIQDWFLLLISLSVICFWLLCSLGVSV